MHCVKQNINIYITTYTLNICDKLCIGIDYANYNLFDLVSHFKLVEEAKSEKILLLPYILNNNLKINFKTKDFISSKIEGFDVY